MSFGGFPPMGIMDESGGGFLEQGGNASADKKRSRDRESLTPVTIKQIKGSTNDGDSIKLDGVDLFLVKIMGFIENVEEHSTNLTYQLNDGTGVIECKDWISKDAGSNSAPSSHRENTFVSVTGNLREYEGRTHIQVYNISTVVNFNEMTHHLLDVILVHCQNTRGPIPVPLDTKSASMSASMSTPARGKQFQTQSQVMTSPSMPLNMNKGSLNKPQAEAVNSTGVTAVQQAIIDILLEFTAGGGMASGGATAQWVQQRLLGLNYQISLADCVKTLTLLSHMGRVFSGGSDDQYCAI